MFNTLIKILAVAPKNCEHTFFGLVQWYHYLPAGDFPGGTYGCSIGNFSLLPQNGGKSDIPFILLAVVDDLLRVAGLIAVGFILYGAIQYVVSQGQPEKTARAQNTITDALVGLVVAIAAISIVSFLGNKLGGP